MKNERIVQIDALLSSIHPTIHICKSINVKKG